MVVDLTYLEGATDGDKELISQLVQIFTEQVEEFTSEMRISLENLDSERLRRVAHKAKGSISSLGMNEVREMLQEMEDYCVGREKIDDLVDVQEKVDWFVERCRVALVELNSYLEG
ncbi:MAG: Hpt domain-containing protein [Bacteroidia bacterium]|nr:Hpt domain-containing protein [Bacteroidia bacterium]